MTDIHVPSVRVTGKGGGSERDEACVRVSRALLSEGYGRGV
jgi:hypothetical protein